MTTSQSQLVIRTITNGPFMENCYIVQEPVSGEALIIDPGDEPDRIVNEVHSMQAKVVAIVGTHGHIDHVGAVAPVAKALSVPFHIHEADREWVEHLPESAMTFGLPAPEVPAIDGFLTDGQQMNLGTHQLKVLHTPGHTAGGCCLWFESDGVVFVGDTLFARSIGRTDLPGGDMGTLLDSIRSELFVLDDSVRVLSGHGPETTIGEERRYNPFLAPDSPA